MRQLLQVASGGAIFTTIQKFIPEKGQRVPALSERLGLIPAEQEHVLKHDNGKQRFIQVVNELSIAFALCGASEEAVEVRDDIAIFQAIKAKRANSSGAQRPPEAMDAAIRQLVSKARMADEGIIDETVHLDPIGPIPSRSTRPQAQERSG